MIRTKEALAGIIGPGAITARIVGAVLLIFYFPALTIAALLVIATSAGPPFINRAYRNRDGRRIDIWEVRTVCWKDWQTTQVGQFVRESGLYRMPALINIVAGHIGLGEKLEAFEY